MEIQQGISQILSPEEAAKYLCSTVQTLAKWRWENKGPKYIKKGNRFVRYRLSDLEAWINSHEVDPEKI